MLQYDWGSSSNSNPNSQSVVPIIDETGSYEPDPALTIYHHDPFNQQQTTHHFNPETHFIPSVNPLFQTPHNNSHQTTAAHHHHHHHGHHHQHFANATMYDASQRVYDTRTDGSYPLPLTLEPIGFVKPEPVAAGLEWGIGNSGGSSSSRLGLNLGGRTFYAEDDFVNRLYRRSRMLEPGSVSAPRCQAEGCNADLSHAKHYHRRHKVCEFHSKASTVIANGLTQRFCQQCSRFHLLPEFDNGKRSCRKRLADHNRRRRKSQQQPNQENNTNKSQLENNNNNSSSENATRSPSDSRAHSSSVTIAISPPRISVDCFGHGSYNNNGASASTSSTSSLFYSNG